MRKLQVQLNEKWHYVFCRNELKRDPVTTEDKSKALPAHALEYFTKHFANHIFRVE